MKKLVWKHAMKRMITFIMILLIAGTSIPVSAKEKTAAKDTFDRYLTVDGKEMHVVMYGDITDDGSESYFTNKDKTTMVMLPALGVPSPHLYFKPIAQALDSDFNVVIVEPLGYGLSETTNTSRTVNNINTELNEALDILEIEECVLLVHSISGVYGLNYVLEYPEKIKGFVAIDNTIYDEAMLEMTAMEQEYMLAELNKFQEQRDSFETIEDFRTALSKDPEKYGAVLPEIAGYTYSERDKEEYITAFSQSNNETIMDEVKQMNKTVETIKGKKFPDSLPVTMMIAAANVERVPAWETGHQDQLNLKSNNHIFTILDGDHYIWYTNLNEVVNQIMEWKDTFKISIT